jgi:hypothetical protein
MAREKVPRKVGLVFFRNDAGGEPVRDWLKGLDEAERRAIGTDLLRAQWRWPVGMPLCRSLGKGLWEVQPTFLATALREYWFALTKADWSRCTDSSSRLGPRLATTWRWRGNVRRSLSNE